MAVDAIAAHDKEFTKSWREEPFDDFYHPYRISATVFSLSSIPELQLLVVTDAALGFEISHAATQDGLRMHTAHEELRPLCALVPDWELEQIIWPSLQTFAAIWVQLSARELDMDAYIVYLGWAGQIFAANGLDEGWCKVHLPGTEYAGVIKQLLQCPVASQEHP